MVTAWGDPQPRGEVLLGAPLGQISADLGDDLQDAVLGMCGQYREVAALAHLREDAAQVGDVWRIDAGALARPEICGSRRLARVVVLAQQHFDLPIAFGNLALVVLPALQCLAQYEQVLDLPSPAQRLLDALRLIAPDPQIAQPSSRSGSRSPSSKARTTAKPLTPVSELMTSWSLTFMRSSAFCMCCTCVAAELMWSARSLR